MYCTFAKSWWKFNAMMLTHIFCLQPKFCLGPSNIGVLLIFLNLCTISLFNYFRSSFQSFFLAQPTDVDL